MAPPGPEDDEDLSLSFFKAATSDCREAIVPVRLSIILAMSALEGSAMGEEMKLADGGWGGGLVGGAAAVGHAAAGAGPAEREEEDRRDRDTRLSRALTSRVGGPRLRRL